MHVSIAGAALVVSFLLVSVLVSVKEIELRLASSSPPLPHSLLLNSACDFYLPGSRFQLPGKH